MLVDKFNIGFLERLKNVKLRQQADIWINFRKLLQLFEGCENWIIDVNKWNHYRLWALLDKPQKLIKLIHNYKINIQKIHPKNIENVVDQLQGESYFAKELISIIEFIVEQYQFLLNEEQIANYLDQSDELESRQQTQESGILDFKEQPSMELTISKPNSACKKNSSSKISGRTQRSNTIESKSNYMNNSNLIALEKQKKQLQTQIQFQKEILKDLQNEHIKTIQQIDIERKKLNSTSKIDKILNSLNRSRRQIN